jgi:hypothetical protein
MIFKSFFFPTLILISMVINGIYSLFLYKLVLFKETDANNYSITHIFKLIKRYKNNKNIKYIILLVISILLMLFFIFSVIYSAIIYK